MRERQLLELAEELFAERGYAGTSMDELCRRAGVTKPVVYELFGSKDGLFRACLEGSASALAEVITDAVRAQSDARGEAARRRARLPALRRRPPRGLGGPLRHRRARFAGEAELIRSSQAILLRDLLAEGARRASTSAAGRLRPRDQRRLRGARPLGPAAP